VFAAVAAATALAYPLAFAAVAWLLLRLVNGFCIAGLTATIESWLNERSSNGTRGRVLGLYMVTHYLAVASGQLLVNLGDITRPDLFMLAAGLIGLSLVPVALTRLGAPALDGHRSLSIRELYAASPAGVVGAGVAGLLVGSFYALGVVFARKIGLSVSEASLFMSMVVLGGFSFQWPIGMLADRHDRRLVLSGVLVAAGVSWPLLASLTASGLPLLGLLVLALLFGGAISSVYPICVAQTFDRLERKHYVAAAGRLLLFYAVGATAGPLAYVDDHGRTGPVQLLRFRNRRGSRLRRLRRLSRPQAAAAACGRTGSVSGGTQRRLRFDVPQLLAPDLLDPRDSPRRPPAWGAACSVAASTSPTRSPRRYTPQRR
jgi:MFS family permease